MPVLLGKAGPRCERLLDVMRTWSVKTVHLSGVSLRSKERPNGDIAIEFTGLRRGEKVSERRTPLA